MPLYRWPPTLRCRVARARPLRHRPQRRRVGLPAWHLKSARHRSETWAAALRHFRGEHHDRASVGNHARCGRPHSAHVDAPLHRCAVPAPTPMPVPPVPQCRSTLTGRLLHAHLDPTEVGCAWPDGEPWTTDRKSPASRVGYAMELTWRAIWSCERCRYKPLRRRGLFTCDKHPGRGWSPQRSYATGSRYYSEEWYAAHATMSHGSTR